MSPIHKWILLMISYVAIIWLGAEILMALEFLGIWFLLSIIVVLGSTLGGLFGLVYYLLYKDENIGSR